MKFVCESCARTEEAASVEIEAGQVVLVCPHCGHRHPLLAKAADGTPAGEAGEGAELGPPSAADAAEAARSMDELFEVPAGEAGAPSGGVGEEAAPASPPATAEDAGDAQPASPAAARGAAEEVERAPTPAAREESAGLPPVKCPKCFHRQDRADFCERCGLDLSLAVPDHAWEVVPEGREEAHAAADALWEAIERSPRSAERHEAFLGHCAEHGLLELAVRRYRSRLADRPDEQPTGEFLAEAVRRLESMALALLTADSWTDDLTRRVATARRILIVVAAVLLLVGLLVLFLIYRQQGTVLPDAM